MIDEPLPAKRALIDFDILPYLYGFVHQKDRYRVLGQLELIDGQESRLILAKDLCKRDANAELLDNDKAFEIESYKTPSPLAVCLADVRRAVQTILDDNEVTDYQGFMTGPGNYRNYTATVQPYKGNRHSEKPLMYDQIKQFLLDNYKVIVAVGNEADDLLSIAQVSDGSTVICSIDKDLRISPGRHYNISTKEKSFISKFGYLEIKVSGAKTPVKKLVGGGQAFFWAQCLMGDSTDNIPKVPGYGDVKVFKTLETQTTHFECFEVVRDIYNKTWGDVEGPRRLLEIGRLLWMQQSDYEVWYPPECP